MRTVVGLEPIAALEAEVEGGVPDRLVCGQTGGVWMQIGSRRDRGTGMPAAHKSRQLWYFVQYRSTSECSLVRNPGQGPEFHSQRAVSYQPTEQSRHIKVKLEQQMKDLNSIRTLSPSYTELEVLLVGPVFKSRGTEQTKLSCTN